MEELQGRRDFLRGLVLTGAAPFLPASLFTRSAAFAASVAPAVAPVTHLPRTIHEFEALPRKERTLIAAATASGCDAVAYYKLGEDGQFNLTHHIDIYPERQTVFAPRDAGQGLLADPQLKDESLHTDILRIPVTDELGNVQGMVALHAPSQGYGRVQTAQEAANEGDMHEPMPSFKAKLEMARYMLQNDSATLLADGTHFSQNAPRSVAQKAEYFKTMREHFMKVLGEDSTQGAHVKGVADLMDIAVDVINDASMDRPIIGAAQKNMLHDITVLHDVGKAQMSTAFLNKKWRDRTDDKAELTARQHYDMGQNHNHPLFSYLTLSAYPDEAMMTAAHHHGLFRYTDQELEKGLGAEDSKRFKILTDNVPFDELPALSKFMRVCDVTDAATGNLRGDKSIHVIIKELAEKGGYGPSETDPQRMEFKPMSHNPNSMDPDYLCMLLAHGFFDKFGENKGPEWKNKDGVPKYNPAEVQKIKQEVLEAAHWQERGPAIEAKLRTMVQESAFVRSNASVVQKC